MGDVLQAKFEEAYLVRINKCLVKARKSKIYSKNYNSLLKTKQVIQ